MPTMDDGGRVAGAVKRARKRARKSRFAAATSSTPIIPTNTPSHSHHPNQLTPQKLEAGEIIEDVHKRQRLPANDASAYGYGSANAYSTQQQPFPSANTYANAQLPFPGEPPQSANPYACAPPPPPPPPPSYKVKNGHGTWANQFFSTGNGYGNGGCCPPSSFISPVNCARPTIDSGDGQGVGLTVFLSDIPVELGSDGGRILDIFSGAIPLNAPPAIRVNESRGGKCLAWVTFGKSSEAKAAVRLAKTRGLRARIHKDSSTTSPQGYDRRVSTVLNNGGLANTLLLRNAPPSLAERELRSFLSGVPLLRIRTAPLGGKRAFWLVYASKELAKKAHAAMSRSKTPWTLRCGETYTPKPMLHDDSVDADAKKRRRNLQKLGNQKSTGDIFKDAGVDQMPSKPAANALEQFLLYNNSHLCLFMKG